MVTAGTSDGPVAEEACETLVWMGVQVVAIRDVGVAGPHRLPAQLEKLVGVDAAERINAELDATRNPVAGVWPCSMLLSLLGQARDLPATRDRPRIVYRA